MKISSFNTLMRTAFCLAIVSPAQTLFADTISDNVALIRSQIIQCETDLDNYVSQSYEPCVQESLNENAEDIMRPYLNLGAAQLSHQATLSLSELTQRLSLCSQTDVSMYNLINTAAEAPECFNSVQVGVPGSGGAGSTSNNSSGFVPPGSAGGGYSINGNTVMGNNGVIYTTNGNITTGSDGSIYTTTGNVTVGSDGAVYTTSGNTTVGSNGTVCTTSGTVTTCL